MYIVQLFVATLAVSAAFISHPRLGSTHLFRNERNQIPSMLNSGGTGGVKERCTITGSQSASGRLAAAGASGVEVELSTVDSLGVIVCDHGSRRESANEMLSQVAERYRSFSGAEIVEPAHMELAKPSIEEAFDRCVAAGAKKIVLHPFFLSPGRHVMSDIPALMNEAAERHPDVAWAISEPLGLQELMPQVMFAAVSDSVASGAWQFGRKSG